MTAGYTIENYVPPELLANAIKKRHPGAQVATADRWTNPLDTALVTRKPPRVGKIEVDKVQLARDVVGAWHGTIGGLYDLDERVRELLAFVHGANGISAAPEPLD